MAVKYFISKNNKLTTTYERKIYFGNTCEMIITKCYLIMNENGILYFLGF